MGDMTMDELRGWFVGRIPDEWFTGAPEVTVQAFAGRGHGFFNAKRGDGEDFEATLAGIVAGLKKLGWVEDKH